MRDAFKGSRRLSIVGNVRNMQVTASTPSRLRVQFVFSDTVLAPSNVCRRLAGRACKNTPGKGNKGKGKLGASHKISYTVAGMLWERVSGAASGHDERRGPRSGILTAYTNWNLRDIKVSR